LLGDIAMRVVCVLNWIVIIVVSAPAPPPSIVSVSEMRRGIPETPESFFCSL
jgi:hypothetical protein